MKQFLITKLIAVLLATLDEKLVADALDVALDYIENKVKDSDSKYDDAIVMPILGVIRNALNVPQDGD